MIPELRERYNREFTEAKYRRFLDRLDDRMRVKIEFTVCETPLFVPKKLQRECEEAAIELALRAHDPEYLSRSDATLSPGITVANQPEHAAFVVVDFALTRDENGELAPRLVELQGFPSLMGYQLLLAELVQEHFGLPPELEYVNGGHSRSEFIDLLRRTIVADHDLENVVLMELDPWHQKTSPDFRAIQELLGIAVVDVRTVIKQGNQLFYRNGRTRVPIRRIFNRAIVDEIERKNVVLPFNWNDDLDVEWAGHPNWYFRISKFTLPFLDHPFVPKARFLHDLQEFPDDLDGFVLKPLYSFAGTGVIVGPTREQLEAIPVEMRQNYLLQERIEWEGVIDTPDGLTKAEMRVMLIWPPDEARPRAVMGLVRTGRGAMMGVDHNKGMRWIGASCNFFEPS